MSDELSQAIVELDYILTHEDGAISDLLFGQLDPDELVTCR